MPWVLISESGLDYSLSTASAVSMTGSVVTTTNQANTLFDVSLSQRPGAQFRITPVNYFAVGSIVSKARFATVDNGSPTTVLNANGNTAFTPTPILLTSFIDSGDAYIHYQGSNVPETYAYQIEVFITPEDFVEPIGRTFEGYVSAYSAAQVQQIRARRFQSRLLVANFNGALNPAEKITSVRWDTTSPWSTFMHDAQISEDQRRVAVKVDFNYCGWSSIKATVTTDLDTVENYEFQIFVKDMPLYPEAEYLNVSGPFSLTKTLP